MGVRVMFTMMTSSSSITVSQKALLLWNFSHVDWLWPVLFSCFVEYSLHFINKLVNNFLLLDFGINWASLLVIIYLCCASLFIIVCLCCLVLFWIIGCSIFGIDVLFV